MIDDIQQDPAEMKDTIEEVLQTVNDIQGMVDVLPSDIDEVMKIRDAVVDNLLKTLESL